MPELNWNMHSFFVLHLINFAPSRIPLDSSRFAALSLTHSCNVFPVKIISSRFVDQAEISCSYMVLKPVSEIKVKCNFYPKPCSRALVVSQPNIKYELSVIFCFWIILHTQSKPLLLLCGTYNSYYCMSKSFFFFFSLIYINYVDIIVKAKL